MIADCIQYRGKRGRNGVRITLAAFHWLLGVRQITLILLWRFLGLHRAIDLSRTKRQVASIGDRHFVVVQRQNKPDYQWEEVLNPSLDMWSPWHALCTYVQLTSSFVPAGGFLLVALSYPYNPLSSDTIASLTRKELKRFGVDTFCVWSPHRPHVRRLSNSTAFWVYPLK